MIMMANSTYAAVIGPGTPEEPILYFEDFEETGNAPGEGIDGSQAYMSPEGTYNPLNININVDGQANTTYFIRLWGKTILENPAKCGILISWRKLDNTWSPTFDLCWKFTLTDEYKEVTGAFDLVFTVPEEHNRVRFGVYNTDRSGVMILDNVCVEVIYPSAPQSLIAQRDITGEVALSWGKAEMPNLKYRRHQVEDGLTPMVQKYNIYCSENPNLTKDSLLIASIDHEEEQENYIWSSGSFGTRFSERFLSYYFVVTAVDTNGRESVVSNEVGVEPVIPGSISGIVREKDTVIGLDDVLVVLKTDEDETFSRESRTDAAGHFSFSDLPIGSYYLIAQKDRYEISKQPVFITQEMLSPEEVIIYLEKDEMPTDAPKTLTGEIPVPGIVRLNWLAPGVVEEEGDSDEEAMSFVIYRATYPFGQGDLNSPDIVSFNFTPPVDNGSIPRGMEVEWLDDMDQGIVLGSDYYYRVSAVDLAGNESELSDLLGPINSQMLFAPKLENYLLGEAITEPVELKWSFENEGATQITYVIEYANNENFDKDGVVYRRERGTSNYEIDNFFELPAKSLWYWRVKAVCKWQDLWDSAYSYSDYSQPGSFFVVEQGEHDGLQYVKLIPTYVTKEESVKINFVLNNESNVKIVVYDTRGNTVKVIADGVAFPSGPNELFWNLDTKRGLKVKNGLYLIHFVSEGINSTHNIVVFK